MAKRSRIGQARWILAACLVSGALAHAADTELQIETRAPTPEEAQMFCLERLVGRVNGLFVVGAREGGPAAAAGLIPGDVILEAGGSPLHSRDDLEDAWRVARPGTRIPLRVKRLETFQVLRLALEGPAANPAPAGGGIAWQHAGPGALSRALAEAGRAGRRVLVGLSGAET